MHRGAVMLAFSVGVCVHSVSVPAHSGTIFGFLVAVSITHFSVGDGLRTITLNCTDMLRVVSPILVAGYLSVTRSLNWRFCLSTRFVMSCWAFDVPLDVATVA